MTQQGPIAPLLTDLRRLLERMEDAQGDSASSGDSAKQREVLRMLRSVVLLWAGQNALLRGEEVSVRKWMTDQLDDISEQLSALLAQFNHMDLGSGATFDFEDISAPDDHRKHEQDEVGEVIDFVACRHR